MKNAYGTQYTDPAARYQIRTPGGPGGPGPGRPGGPGPGRPGRPGGPGPGRPGGPGPGRPGGPGPGRPGGPGPGRPGGPPPIPPYCAVCPRCPGCPVWPYPGWPYIGWSNWPCVDGNCSNRYPGRPIFRSNESDKAPETLEAPKVATQSVAASVNDKTLILRQIYSYGQQLTDSLLYLDEHPEDAAAIEYYTQLKEKYNHAADMYRKIYGTLENDYNTDQTYTTWNSIPLPWDQDDDYDL